MGKLLQFLGIEQRKASKEEIANIKALNSLGMPSMSFSSFINSREKATLVSAVYRCVYVISSNVAQLKLGVMKIDSEGFIRRDMTHPADRLLFQDPNPDMGAYTLKACMIVSMLLKGAGFAYIERNKWGDAASITFLQYDSVTIVWVKGKNGIKKRMYQVTGFKDYVDPKDMIHVLNYSENGMDGISTLSQARNIVNLALDSDAQAANFIKSGNATSGFIAAKGIVTDDQKRQIKEGWANGGGDPSSIRVLPGDLDYKSISISPKDAQLLETRQFNVLEICRFFGVPPSIAYDPSSKSYSSQEAEQLSFLNSTLSPLIANLEEEFNRKVFPSTEYGIFKAEFDMDNLIRTDKKSQAEFYKTIYNIGGYTINEIRKKLGEDRIENGDNAFVQVNTQTLDKAVSEEANNTTE